MNEFHIPTPHQHIKVKTGDGTQIHVRRYGNQDGLRVVFSHGNGLAIDTYYPFWQYWLTEYDVVVYDLRSHGWNQPGDATRHTMSSFVWDNEYALEAIATQFGSKPTFGVFHSLSSLIAIQQTLRTGGGWQGLVLFEPPFTPPNGHPMEEGFLQGVNALAQRTRQRQFCFESVTHYTNLLRRVARFDGISDAGLALFARTTLREQESGYALRCPRELEAKIYETNVDSTIGLSMPRLPVPMKSLQAIPRAKM